MSGTVDERTARLEALNDKLHDRLTYWRERSGEQEELLGAVLEIEEGSEVPRWSGALTEKVRGLSGRSEPEELYASLEDWLASRPEAVRKMAETVPLGAEIITKCYVIGYVEKECGEVGIRLSPCDPVGNFALARANSFSVFPEAIITGIEEEEE